MANLQKLAATTEKINEKIHNLMQENVCLKEELNTLKLNRIANENDSSILSYAKVTSKDNVLVVKSKDATTDVSKIR